MQPQYREQRPEDERSRIREVQENPEHRMTSGGRGDNACRHERDSTGSYYESKYQYLCAGGAMLHVNVGTYIVQSTERQNYAQYTEHCIPVELHGLLPCRFLPQLI